MSTFKILTAIEYGGIRKEVVESLEMKPFFKNRLTENTNFEKITNFNNYVQNLVHAFTFPIAIASIDVTEAIEILSLWYEVEPSLVADPENYQQLIETYVQRLIGVTTETPEAQIPEE